MWISNAVRRLEPGLRRQSAERTGGIKGDSQRKDGEDGNGSVCTVNELEGVELSNECEFSLEGVCHSSEASVVLDVGHGSGSYFGGWYGDVYVVSRESLVVAALAQMSDGGGWWRVVFIRASGEEIRRSTRGLEERLRVTIGVASGEERGRGGGRGGNGGGGGERCCALCGWGGSKRASGWWVRQPFVFARRRLA